ncbi:MAG: cysteine desulfurase, partial [Planctomycetota bacterium]|nr:cysteine desulfurase [Planctomycetota bacterium]
MTAPIYLDHNATAPLAPGVLQAMLPFLEQEPFNPSSDYG